MAVDTKPNFSSKKFEQCATDIMNLSGCTQIYGSFDIETGAILTICENAGLGKILTSDADGIATWQTGGGAGITSLSGGSGMNFSPITSTGTIILGTPSAILNTSTDISSGTTHNHAFSASTFVTGTQGILVSDNQFYLDNTYINDSVLPDLNTINNVTSNQSLGVLPTGQTLGMVYITNTGSTQAIVNLGTTALGNDITPFQPITIDAGEDVSVTVNMRLSLTQDTTIYINSTDWTNIGLNVQWAHITFKNVPLPSGGTSLWESGNEGGITTINSNGIIEVSCITCKYIEGVIDIANVCFSSSSMSSNATLSVHTADCLVLQVNKDLILTSSSGTGNTYMCYLPNKTTETCGLYIDGTGKLSTGVISGGTGGGLSTANNGLTVDGTNVRLGGSLTGNTRIDTSGHGLAIGSNNFGANTNSFAFGYYANANGNFSVAIGGDYGYANGQGSVVIGGSNSTAISDGSSIIGSSSSTILTGSNRSAIIGGNGHNISTGNSCSVIIGGNNINVVVDSLPNHAIVPNLAIWNTPSSGTTSDDILIWNSTDKKVKKISASCFTGGTGGSPAGSDGSIQYNNNGVFGGFDYVKCTCGTIHYTDVGDGGLMSGPIIAATSSDDNVWNICGDGTGNPDNYPILNFNLISGFTGTPVTSTLLQLYHNGISLPILPTKTTETCGLYIDASGKLSTGLLSGGTTSPAGSDGSIQYNNGGSFGGTDICWDDSVNHISWGTTPANNTMITIQSDLPYDTPHVDFIKITEPNSGYGDNFLSLGMTCWCPTIRGGYSGATSTGFIGCGLSLDSISGNLNLKSRREDYDFSAISIDNMLSFCPRSTLPYGTIDVTEGYMIRLSGHSTCQDGLYYNNCSAWVRLDVTGGTGGVPAGVDGAMQYNNGGSFGGTCLNWDDSLNTFGFNTTAEANTLIKAQISGSYNDADGAFLNYGITDGGFKEVLKMGFKPQSTGGTYICAMEDSTIFKIIVGGYTEFCSTNITFSHSPGQSNGSVTFAQCVQMNGGLNVGSGTNFNIQCSNFTPPRYLQTTEPTVSAYQMKIWIDTDDSNRTYLLYNNGITTKKVELT